MNQSALLCRFAREADSDCFLLAGRYTLLDRSAPTSSCRSASSAASP